MVVGWYHSHPGFGCWLSGVDINTQQSFEALSERAVAVVVDPIQSVKGKVMVHTGLQIPYLDKRHKKLVVSSPHFASCHVVSFLLIRSHIVSFLLVFFYLSIYVNVCSHFLGV